MKKNKGFSFIEMILVIGIMAILTAVAGISLGLIARSNVNKAASEFSSSLSQARTMSMAKGTLNGKWILTYSNERIYSYVGNESNMSGNAVKIAQRPVNVEFIMSSGSVIQLNDAQSKVTFSFDQSNGSFSSVSLGGTCKAIRIYSDRSNVYIKLYEETGKHVITDTL